MRTQTTAWICDLCGNGANTTDDDHPTGWFGLGMLPTPVAIWAEAVRLHGCSECWISFQGWRDTRSTPTGEK